LLLTLPGAAAESPATRSRPANRSPTVSGKQLEFDLANRQAPTLRFYQAAIERQFDAYTADAVRAARACA
jgi:hypothetical protein